VADVIRIAEPMFAVSPADVTDVTDVTDVADVADVTETWAAAEGAAATNPVMSMADALRRPTTPRPFIPFILTIRNIPNMLARN
jgi:hypothetical protein